VRTYEGPSDDFPITIGLHEGSTLSSYLFIFVLDVLADHVQELATICLFFVDDVVLFGEMREELNGKLET
jgi:hypothetical protein